LAIPLAYPDRLQRTASVPQLSGAICCDEQADEQQYDFEVFQYTPFIHLAEVTTRESTNECGIYN
jgi:hypothetical protein